jgi:DHA1 family bicyclomycin/chloramphenicol resistance-like MFS transporter
VVGYAELLMQRRLLGYALAGAAFYGAVYAYLAGTPFAYIVLYHLPAEYYGLLFGLNIVGMMAMNVLNTRLVPRIGGDRVLRGGMVCIGLAGLAIAITARTGLGGLAGLVAPVFVLISMNGAVVANSVAGALSAFPRRAGAASALIGAMQFGAGILTTALVGLLADGTAFPYAAIICVCGLLGVASTLLLLRGPTAAE